MISGSFNERGRVIPSAVTIYGRYTSNLNHLHRNERLLGSHMVRRGADIRLSIISAPSRTVYNRAHRRDGYTI